MTHGQFILYIRTFIDTYMHTCTSTYMAHIFKCVYHYVILLLLLQSWSQQSETICMSKCTAECPQARQSETMHLGVSLAAESQESWRLPSRGWLRIVSGRVVVMHHTEIFCVWSICKFYWMFYHNCVYVIYLIHILGTINLKLFTQQLHQYFNFQIKNHNWQTIVTWVTAYMSHKSSKKNLKLPKSND
jgi:hypothetical protein